MLSIGTKAPAFKLYDEKNIERTLKEFAGRYVLLYFYPKDDTPGCTREACAISDVYNDFQKKKVIVMGVSKDSAHSHKKFKEKYALPFILLSDPTQIAIKLYKADRTLGSKRISYLIGPDGTILRTYPKVDPATHAVEILNDLNTLLQK
jgi:peroxiredoxin Q/BCP